MRRIPAGRVGLLWLAACGTAVGAPNAWSPIGPDGGYMRGLEFHPTRVGVAYTAAEKLFYRSADAGVSWQASAHEFSDPISVFAISPADGDQVYAFETDHGLWHSSDGGQSFQFAGAVGGNCLVVALAVSRDGTRLAATCAFAERLYVSDDAGASWTARTPDITPYSAGSYFATVSFGVASKDVIFAGRRNGGVFRSIDAGLHWSLVFSDSIVPLDYQIVVDPGNADRIYLGTASQVYRSQDGGDNWSWVMGANGPALGIDTANTGRLYSGSISNAAFRSTDDGVQWQQRNTDDGVTCGWISFLRVNPLDPQQILAAGDEGICRSADAGNTWRASSTGVHAIRVQQIRVAPGSSRRLLIGLMPGPAFVSTDPGGTWTRLDQQSFRAGGAPGGTNAVEFVAGAAGTDWYLAPRTIAPVRTRNGGNSWEGSGLTTPALDVVAGADASILFAASASGAYRSQDGGVIWNTLAMPAGFGNPGTFAVSASQPSVVYAGAGAGGAIERGVSRSSDGGSTWSLANAGISSTAVSRLAVHPTDANVVYAATSAGLYRSRNGGQSWIRLESYLQGFIAADDVQIDPLHPEIVYAVYGRALRSVDGGDSWEPLDGVPTNNVPSDFRRIAVDRQDPQILYGATVARGLQMLDIAPDLALAADAGAGRVTYQLRNNGRFTATGLQLQASWGTAAGTATLQASRGTCTAAGAGFSCQLAQLKPGESASIIADIRGATGPLDVDATLSAREHDSASTNNVVRSSIAMTAGGGAGNAGNSGSGGGGALGCVSIALLLAMLSQRRRRAGHPGLG